MSLAIAGKSLMLIFSKENFLMLTFSEISQKETVLTKISLFLEKIISLLLLLKMSVFNTVQIKVWVSNRYIITPEILPRKFYRLLLP